MRLELLEAELRELDAELRELVNAQPTWKEKASRMSHIKGVSEVTVWTLLAYLPELGELSKRQVAALVGLAPMAKESGKYQGQRTCGRRRTKVKSVLWMASLSTLQHEEPFKAFDKKLKDKVKPSSVARVAGCRKLLTPLNAMLERYRKRIRSEKLVEREDFIVVKTEGNTATLPGFYSANSYLSPSLFFDQLLLHNALAKRLGLKSHDEGDELGLAQEAILSHTSAPLVGSDLDVVFIDLLARQGAGEDLGAHQRKIERRLLVEERVAIVLPHLDAQRGALVLCEDPRCLDDVTSGLGREFESSDLEDGGCIEVHSELIGAPLEPPGPVEFEARQELFLGVLELGQGVGHARHVVFVTRRAKIWRLRALLGQHDHVLDGGAVGFLDERARSGDLGEFLRVEAGHGEQQHEEGEHEQEQVTERVHPCVRIDPLLRRLSLFMCHRALSRRVFWMTRPCSLNACNQSGGVDVD